MRQSHDSHMTYVLMNQLTFSCGFCAGLGLGGTIGGFCTRERKEENTAQVIQVTSKAKSV